MYRPSRRAVVLAASFALAFASVAPSAHAGRNDDDDDTEEESDGLLGLIDITDLLGDLPLLGEGDVGEFGVPALDGLPTVEGIGLPTLEGLGLPALEGLGLPALEGVLDPSTGSGLNLNVLIDVGLSGGVNLL